jgi:hypothetical protein
MLRIRRVNERKWYSVDFWVPIFIGMVVVMESFINADLLFLPPTPCLLG